MYLGRVVEPGDPYWLPEDRDIIDLWQFYARTRHEPCGRWAWEEEQMEHMVLDYDVCPFCEEMDVFDQERQKNRKSMAGVSYYYRPLNPNDPDERKIIFDGH